MCIRDSLLAGRAERLAQAPHLGLGAPDQLGDGVVVAFAGCVEQGTQGVVAGHRGILPPPFQPKEPPGNSIAVADDFDDMACSRWMVALSAEADGEDPGVDARLLAAHLRGCADCRAFAEDLRRLRRHSGIDPAPQMPDMAPRVSKLNAIADRASAWTAVRLLLAVVAVFILVDALPALVLGHEESTSEHAARHLGAFAAAYAVALLVVVVRPARARSILPVAAVLAGALVITATIDVADGHIPLVEETAHFPELLSVVLVWLLARPSGVVPAPGAARRAAAPPLRLLAPEPDPDVDQRESG